MISKRKILQLALALIKSGDIDLLEEDSTLYGQGLSVDDQEKAREIGRIVYGLCKNYSYLSSVAFELETNYKSADFVRMKSKLESDPARKMGRLEDIYDAIRYAANGTEALQKLIRQDQQVMAVKLCELLGSIDISNE